LFLPTTPQELCHLGWDALDIVLVTGDSYIDSPFIGAALIGKLLLQAGYRVGIIAQPDVNEPADIGRLGQPILFWGVTAGAVDSMVANYTALKKKRRTDDYTPGGINNRRPDRASIVYTNLIRRFSNLTSPGQASRPIVLGGIEASLRRIAHYDFWSNRLRASLLFDAKADYLVYGMAEKAILELAGCLKRGLDPRQVRGLCYISRQPPSVYLQLPDYETVVQDKQAFIDMFHTFYQNNDPLTAKGLFQKHGDRFLVQNPPALPLSQPELDGIYALDFERDQHPHYQRLGPVRALETIRFSIASHRGCYGECSFCAIAVHEGRTVLSRSPSSILAEAEQLTRHPQFKGVIHDLCGPTANMYGFECTHKLESGSCPHKRCLYPNPCPFLPVDHRPQLDLLQALRRLPGVEKVFVASGIRPDLLLADPQHAAAYIDDLVHYHVSGQMKLAPEHSDEAVLAHMGKPGPASLLRFKQQFDRRSQAAGKRQFLTYYFIAAHPGCTEAHMQRLKRFVSQKLRLNPQQVQIFTPTPSTYATLMYYTELDPFTLQSIFVEKDPRRKERQKTLLTAHAHPLKPLSARPVTPRRPRKKAP
jgi:uncharacterized radical SAM protein YgiQ